MVRIVSVLVALFALGLPASAAAGGWATVGLSSLPDATPRGGVWTVDVEVLQHGRTPLEGVQPAVVVQGRGGAEQRFAARATSRPGVYRATVRVPAAGPWSYEVDDGFGRRHAFGAVEASPAPAVATAPSGGSDGRALLGAAIAAVVAAGLTAAALRRRPPARGHVPGGGAAVTP